MLSSKANHSQLLATLPKNFLTSPQTIQAWLLDLAATISIKALAKLIQKKEVGFSPANPSFIGYKERGRMFQALEAIKWNLWSQKRKVDTKAI